MEKLTNEQLLSLIGKKVYLKKIDSTAAEEYAESILNMSIETKILTSTAATFTKDQILKFVDNIVGDTSRADFIIYNKETNQIIGDLALIDIDRQNRNCNIRIALDNKNIYGKGLGTEALLLALNYGFGMLNMHRIELDVLTENERAIHVYKKLGFVEEGIKREVVYFDYKYHNLLIMSCLKKEFTNKISK